MAQQTYSKVTCYWNGNQLQQETEVTIKRSSGSQPVKTVSGGYAGESPGSPMCEITVTSAVPMIAMEFDPGGVIQNLTPGQLTLFCAGKTLTTGGQIFEDNLTHGVDTAAKQSFSLRAPMAQWQ